MRVEEVTAVVRRMCPVLEPDTGRLLIRNARHVARIPAPVLFQGETITAPGWAGKYPASLKSNEQIRKRPNSARDNGRCAEDLFDVGQLIRRILNGTSPAGPSAIVVVVSSLFGGINARSRSG